MPGTPRLHRSRKAPSRSPIFPERLIGYAHHSAACRAMRGLVKRGLVSSLPVMYASSDEPRTTARTHYALPREAETIRAAAREIGDCRRAISPS
jgi:hypothetical protein